MNPLKMMMRKILREPSCEEVNMFLAEYLEGTLPDKTQQKFSAHLNKCPVCLPYFQQYKTTIELVKNSSDVVVPDQLVEHTLDFLREHITA
jgi:predicted anti-sigma-YlaC factor YlaD